MKPQLNEILKVTCKLLDGRVNSIDGIFTLDSIIYHAWFLKNAPGVIDGTLSYEKNEDAGRFDVPIRALKEHRYACSWGFYHEYEQNVEYWTKKPNFSSLDGLEHLEPTKANKINTSSGSLKAYRTPQTIRLIGDIEFYCVGNKELIEEYLSYMLYIGKKPAAGWGVVKEWIVETFPEDWSTYSPKYGIMRPLELEEFITYPKDRAYEMRKVGIRPPYWKHTNQRACVVPKVNTNDAS